MLASEMTDCVKRPCRDSLEVNFSDADLEAHPVIDIREIEELATKPYTATSTHIPMDDLFEQTAELAKFDKESPLYILCNSGRRSLRACCWLRELGFKHAYSLRGGIDAWLKK